jgi:endoglucanase
MKRYLVFLILVLIVAACQQPSSSPVLEPQREWVWWRGVNLAGAEFAADGSRPGDARGVLPGSHGVQFRYPLQSDVDYNKSKGMNIVRLPFRWERLQPQLFGEFNTAEWNRLKTFVRQTTAKGVNVIIDPHNYARYYGNLIGSNSVPNSGFVDLWKRLATEFKNDQRVIFNLMNEPYDIPSYQWVDAANAAIAGIRALGASNLILVPGTRYTGAWTWNNSDEFGSSNAQAMKQIKDPYNWFMIEFHQYLDKWGSGIYEPTSSGGPGKNPNGSYCERASIGAERLSVATAWLRQNNLKGFLGEFSTPRNDPVCSQALDQMVKYMEDNADAWRGWTYWAGGSWWSDDLDTLEPVNGQDRPQMDILEKYLPR